MSETGAEAPVTVVEQPQAIPRTETLGQASVEATYQRVRDVYKSSFPEVYVDPEVSVKFSYIPPDIDEASREVLYESPELAYYDPEENSIIVESSKEASDGEDFSEQIVTAGEGKVRAKRRIVDAVILSHEMSHPIYDKITRSRLDTVPEEYDTTVDQALNEGFSTFMQTLFTDTLINNPGMLNLDTDDLAALQKMKMGTLYFIGRSKAHSESAYRDGTFRIMHKLFVSAAGPPGKRDVSSGLRAIKDYLERVDRDKAVTIKRDNAVYKGAVEKGDPELLMSIIGDDEIKEQSAA